MRLTFEELNITLKILKYVYHMYTHVKTNNSNNS